MRGFLILFLAIFIFLPAASANSAQMKENASVRLRLEDVDLNRDHIISADESRAYLKRLEDEYNRELERQLQATKKTEVPKAPVPKSIGFHPADTNRDGAVSIEENTAYLERFKPKTAPIILETQQNGGASSNQERRAEDIANFDLNKDGILQVDELQKSSSTKFDIADTDKDGILSSKETAEVIKKFNGGKKVITQEANRLSNKYKNADANNDGKISKSEYESHMGQQHKTFDRNGDGIISKEEYRSDGEKQPSYYLLPKK